MKNLSTEKKLSVTTDNYNQVVEEAAQRAVFLEIESGTGIGSGSGTLISCDGYILTANHNVEDEEGNIALKIRARLYTPGAVGGDYRWMDCEILASRVKDCDMALLKIKGTNFPVASLRPEDHPVDNTEEIFMVGYPLGGVLTGNRTDDLRYSQASGRISSIQKLGEIERCYADIKGLHGDSGAGIYSKQDGRIIGVFIGSVVPDLERSPDELNFFYPIRFFWSHFPIHRSLFVSKDPIDQNEETREK